MRRRAVVLAAGVAVLLGAAGLAWMRATSDPTPARAAEVAATAIASTPAPHQFAPPRVEVSTGLDLDQAEATATITAIVNDHRAWNTDLDQLTVHIARPSFIRAACGRFIPEAPHLSACSFGTDVWIGADVWTAVLPQVAAVAGTLADQRTWFVLHEVGHLLGLGHQECTTPGTPAPVMRSTMSKLHGCTLNVWPAGPLQG